MKRLKLAEQHLTERNHELLLTRNKIADKLKRIVSRQVLENDDKQVKFYTGLPSFVALKAVFDLAIKGLLASF